MILGLDFYDTISAYPKALRLLANDIIVSGGQVHIVTAIKRVNEERVYRHIRDARVPYSDIHIVFYENYNDIPKLKVPVYKELGCDIIVEDNPMVILEARLRGLCALEIAGQSLSPLAVS